MAMSVFEPAILVRGRRQIQLPHPQALIGDVGGEKVCDRENGPKPRNNMLPPGQRGGGVMSYPVHLDKRRDDCGTGRENLIDGRSEFISAACLIRQGP